MLWLFVVVCCGSWCLLVVWLLVWTTLRRTPSAGPPPPERPKFRSFFSLSRHSFLFFIPSLVGLFRGILVVFEAPVRSNVHVWALGLSCETPAAHPSGTHPSGPHPSGPHHIGAPPLRGSTTSGPHHFGPPPFGPPPFKASQLRAPLFLGLAPHPRSLNRLSKLRLAKIGLAKIGLAKIGLAKIGPFFANHVSVVQVDPFSPEHRCPRCYGSICRMFDAGLRHRCTYLKALYFIPLCDSNGFLCVVQYIISVFRVWCCGYCSGLLAVRCLVSSPLCETRPNHQRG